MDALLYGLAASAAKAVFSLWATGSVSPDIAVGAGEVVKASLLKEKDRRAADRQISSMAERIFEQLEPVISIEYKNLGEAEASVVMEAVQKAVSISTDTARTVIEHDFDSLRLEAAIKPKDAELSALGLSEEAEHLLELLLAECCDYITEIAARLPQFETEAAREILRRETSLMEMAQATFIALPRSRVPRSFGAGDDHERFETRYVRAVATYAEKLELFGVTSVTARRPYDLSVAYISLSIAVQGDEKTSGSGDAPDEQEGAVSRADAYFSEHSRVLLTGDAGSGKTTLLRWLAGLSARDSPIADKAGSWRQRVPFIIPLRQFADDALPTPGLFVNLIKPNLAEATPPGWAHQILEEGRGALLVDGLDEVPVARRKEVLDWIVELDSDFPGNSILVTSRGAALTKEWKQSELLERATLQPMTPSDIQSFVNHWHDAMRRSALADERQQVSDAHVGMLNVIKTRPNIQALSKTPLLCALMCALHLENASSLPSDKMSLYRTAIEMLVMKRDNDRRLARSDTQLNLSDRLVLLQRLAIWMHENGLADASHGEYQAAIERSLVALNRPSAEAAETAAFLLERCGILREPTPGRVDFIHRSFLEYLAAAAEVEDDSISKLLLHATEEPWREVIVMAAGHANNAQRRHLIEGLLARGAAEPGNMHQLYLIAVATLQTVRALDPDLRDSLQVALNAVLPPANMTEASAVASAGSSAAPLLRRRADLKVLEAVASVRALSLIGGPEAFEALRTYRREARITVIRQLLRAWTAFDTKEYASEILAGSRFIRGSFTVTEPEHIPYLAKFERLENINIDISERMSNWNDLSALEGDERVETLSLSNLRWAVNLVGVPVLPALSSLTLSNFDNLVSVSGIENFPALRRFEIHGARSLDDLGALASLRGLERLVLSVAGSANLEFLARMAVPISQVWVYSARSAIVTVGGMKVKSLNIVRWAWRAEEQAMDLDGLASSPDITSLRLDCFNLPDVVELPPHLESLHLQRGAATFTGGDALTRLSVYEYPSAEIYALVERAPRLARISISSSVTHSSVMDILSQMPVRANLEIEFHDYHEVDAFDEEPVENVLYAAAVTHKSVIYTGLG
ncbi:energy-coupling factor transporter ATP-binding protein EcfA2 [Clavibacter michiganensis]|uniref:NACHT domain-containing protein n=1 Tax=Clavibacter michiganensis TaxID=28447 RepID=UPI00195ABD4F|nr:NACHT domain-containing protein [Clavibacter michiganensis]MBM7410480.1 energy-coupling factor transporter ATP-binding protein EcfA2 [Clavibacter michiganensis]